MDQVSRLDHIQFKQNTVEGNAVGQQLEPAIQGTVQVRKTNILLYFNSQEEITQKRLECHLKPIDEQVDKLLNVKLTKHDFFV